MQKRINDANSFKTMWIFKYKDEEKKPTWKYLDHIIETTRKTKEKRIYWVKNPHFAYKHLSPFDKNDITIERAKTEFGWKEK